MHFLNTICFMPEYCLIYTYLFAIVPTVFLVMNSDGKRKIIVICELKSVVKLNSQDFLTKKSLKDY